MEISKLDWLQVKNITKTKADVYFYGEIVSDSWEKWSDTDTCPQDVLDILEETKGKELDIYINSPGGSVFAGYAIYNILSRVKEKKICYIDGVAGSIASVICMVGDEIVMPSNSYLMIHKPSNIIWGNATEMRKMADDLDTIQIGIENVYKNKLNDGVDIEVIRGLMDKESWLPANEASKYFKVKLIEENTSINKLSKDSFKNYSNMPYKLKDFINENEVNKNLENNIKENKELKNKLQAELELLSL